jgi:putative transposase
MARLMRYRLAGHLLHVIQRGNNRQKVFFADEDYTRYLGWLAGAALANRCTVHAYVLMPNHVHLLVTPERKDSLPRMMQTLGRLYVRYVNAARGRSGTLWEGRYRAAPIEGEHFLACCRYIETNPVRAGLAERPRAYRWSSYRAHAAGAPDPLAAPHPAFHRLGRNAAARVKAYRAPFRAKPDEDFIAALRAATNGGWALGGAEFRRAVAKASGRRTAPLPRGRPKIRKRKTGGNLR